jgi:DNA-binding CsgD family transcriptional regulator
VEYLGRIESYINAIDASRNIEDVCRAVRAHIEPQGFPLFTYALLLSEKGQMREPLYISRYPSEWTQRYANQRYASDDMAIRFVASSLRPFLWQESFHHQKMTKAQKRIFREAADFHIRSGGSVPIHGPGSAMGSFAVASDLPEREFARLFQRQRHELHLVATYAHERILQIGLRKDNAFTLKLSPREIEVMTWSARGKTAWEISEILSLSEGTVRDHIKNACRRLDTSNKTHAIAVALLHGVIML